MAAREIATDLGFHPLALHLAAAEIVDGASWSELREGLRQEAKRLDVLEWTNESWSLDEQRTRSVLASFELSARRLDPEAREMFAWLGVLRETTLKAEFLTTLWSVDSATANRRLRQLAAKGLLTEISSRRASSCVRASAGASSSGLLAEGRAQSAP
jgi:Fic family protein